MKNIRIKLLLSILSVTSVVVSNVTPVYAGTGIVYEWHNDGFDADYYRSLYPDLAAKYGNNDEALYTHYMTYGYYEGRIGKMKMPVTNKLTILKDGQNFDYQQYAIDNADVVAVIGNKPIDLWNHYKNFGFYEGRKVCSYDPETNCELLLYDTTIALTKDATTDEEKIRICHDWIVNQLTYQKNPKNVGFAQAAMLYKTGVCDDYTKIFEFMMDILGIESQYILGMSNGYGHCWNRVKVNGEWKYLDVTWDDMSLYGDPTIYYDFYLIPLEEMNKSHQLMTPELYTKWTGWTDKIQKYAFGSLSVTDSQTMIGIDC